MLGRRDRRLVRAGPGIPRAWNRASGSARSPRSIDGVEADSPFYALPSATDRRALGGDHAPSVHVLGQAAPRALAPRGAARLAPARPARRRRGHRARPDRAHRRAPGRADRAHPADLRAALRAGRLTCFVLQLTPAFAPGDHRLEELEPVVQGLAPIPVAVELRNRDWFHRTERVLDWYREAGAVFVAVDAPQTGAPMAVPPVDAVTRSDLAYLRALGRDAEEPDGVPLHRPELDELRARAQRLAERRARRWWRSRTAATRSRRRRT